ncbi:MAG: hypothetical protein ACD_79C01529G0001 [uncultured bacterium]|nr:MAG: hypothetical protein ACD_79C01529G0001 [uncultured bacterium]
MKKVLVISMIVLFSMALTAAPDKSIRGSIHSVIIEPVSSLVVNENSSYDNIVFTTNETSEVYKVVENIGATEVITYVTL